MADIDPSILLGYKPQAPVQSNALQSLGQYQGIVNAQAQNALIQQSTKNAELANQTGQQALASTGNMRGTQAIIGAMSDPNFSADTFHAALDQEHAAGTVPDQQYQALSQAIQATGNDPTKLRVLGTRMLVGSLAGPQQAQTLFGQNQDQANGQVVQPGIAASPVMGGGFKPVGPGIQQVTTPGQRAGLVPVLNPDGSPGLRPAGSFPGADGAAPSFGPNGGRNLPPALRNPNAPPAAAPDMTTPNGPAPGKVAAAEATARDSAASFANISQAGVQARVMDSNLSNMQTDLQQYTTGAGAKTWKNGQAMVQYWAPGLAASLGIDPKKLAAQDSFDKLAAQIAMAQGATSDARLGVNQAGNPHSELTPEGADLIIRQLRGNQSYIQARQTLAAQYPDKTNAQGFEATTAKQLDPRAFQYAQMTPAQKATYFNSLPNASDKAALKKAYGFAQSQGLINAP